MTVEQLKTRCKEEFKAKNRGKWIASIVFIVLGFALIAWNIINTITILASGVEFTINFMPFLLILVLFGISGTLTSKRDTAIKKYKKSGEYQDLPVDHPYSLVYPAEPYPFNQPVAAPVSAPAATTVAPAPEAATVAPAPEAATVAPAPEAAPVQLQQVTITCEQCGQPMLIPPTSGSFKITCPKCGNSFVHTN